MFIPPRTIPYEQFPASDLTSEGVISITADRTPTLCRVTSDVEYARRSGMPLRLTIVQPPRTRAGETHPLIVFVQGSAWLKQQLSGSLSGLMRFAERGYVIAIVEYRPTFVAPFPAHVMDALEAIRWMKRHAHTFFADPEKLVLWGDSSGGHTAVMAALAEGHPGVDRAPSDKAPLGVKAVVDYYGPMDMPTMNEAPSVMEHYTPDSPEGRLIGDRHILKHPDLAKAASTTHYIREGAQPPFLIIHGDRDRIVPFKQSITFYEALKAKGHAPIMYKLEGADHGGDAFYTKDVLDIVEGFVKEHI